MANWRNWVRTTRDVWRIHILLVGQWHLVAEAETREEMEQMVASHRARSRQIRMRVKKGKTAYGPQKLGRPRSEQRSGYQRKTVDVWRIYTKRAKRAWTLTGEAATLMEMLACVDQLPQRTKRYVVRYRKGGNNAGHSGRPRKTAILNPQTHSGDAL